MLLVLFQVSESWRRIKIIQYWCSLKWRSREEVKWRSREAEWSSRSSTMSGKYYFNILQKILDLVQHFDIIKPNLHQIKLDNLVYPSERSTLLKLLLLCHNLILGISCMIHDLLEKLCHCNFPSCKYHKENLGILVYQYQSILRHILVLYIIQAFVVRPWW